MYQELTIITNTRLFFFFLRAVFYWRRIDRYSPVISTPSTRYLWQDFKRACQMAKKNKEFYKGRHR